MENKQCPIVKSRGCSPLWKTEFETLRGDVLCSSNCTSEGGGMGVELYRQRKGRQQMTAMEK